MNRSTSTSLRSPNPTRRRGHTARRWCRRGLSLCVGALIWLAAPEAKAWGPGEGRVTLTNVTVGLCRADTMVIRYKLDTFGGQAMVGAMFRWEGDPDCSLPSSLQIAVRVEAGGGGRWVNIHPDDVPRAGRGWSPNPLVPSSPSWNRLLCDIGPQGWGGTNCLSEDAARHLYRNGRVVEVRPVWNRAQVDQQRELQRQREEQERRAEEERRRREAEEKRQEAIREAEERREQQEREREERLERERAEREARVEAQREQAREHQRREAERRAQAAERERLRREEEQRREALRQQRVQERAAIARRHLEQSASLMGYAVSEGFRHGSFLMSFAPEASFIGAERDGVSESGIGIAATVALSLFGRISDTTAMEVTVGGSLAVHEFGVFDLDRGPRAITSTIRSRLAYVTENASIGGAIEYMIREQDEESNTLRGMMGGLFGRLSTNALSRAMQFAFEVTWLPAGASSDTVRLALVGHYNLFGLNLEFMTAPPSRGWNSWEQHWSLSLTAGLNVSW